MYRGLFTGIVIAALAAGLLLYAYGRKSMSDMTSPQTVAYVDSTTETSIKNWMDYFPPSKKFNAKFPTLPQHATDRSLDSKTKEMKQYEMYISESGGQVFMISVITFLNTDKVNNEETLIKGIIDDMVSSNQANKLEKIRFGTYDGHKSSDFEIVNSTYAIMGKAFVYENHLYVLSVLDKTPEEAMKGFDHFVKSFKINKELSDLPASAIEK